MIMVLVFSWLRLKCGSTVYGSVQEENQTAMVSAWTGLVKWSWTIQKSFNDWLPQQQYLNNILNDGPKKKEALKILRPLKNFNSNF
jgi:hypothetical protein